METSVNSEEVIQTNTLTPYNLPNIQDIKSEVCDEDLTLRLDKYDDFDFEPFHETIFRTLSAHFSNKSNVNEIDDACLKLENCFIENNILDKNGLTKHTLKGSPNSYIFLKYRDIDDAFVDMVISESVGKFNKNNKCHKKIDLKHFKDNFFSFDFNDYEDQQSQSSESDSELLGESESIIEPSQSEIDITDGYNSDIESSMTEDTDLLGQDNLVNSGYPHHVRLAKVSNDTNNSKTIDSDEIPLKETVRDVRIMVERLQCNRSDSNFVEEDNLFRGVSSSKSQGTKIKQVARKKTGGMIINTNISESNDAEVNKELKSNQPSKEDDLVPDGFDKMTRADRRKLEKIIAESRQNLVTRTDELLFEKDYSDEKKSDGTPNIKELDSPSVEKELENTSNERESAGTSNVKESNTMSNEKELDDTSNDDKLKENELLKSVVKNTILDFLIKSKGLKMGKEKVDLISDEITKKLNSFIPDEDGTDADDPALTNAGISSTDDNKTDDNASVKSNENREESSIKKRPSPPKKRTTKRNTSSATTRKRLQEFQEIARDIINCELSTPLVDELEESLKPTTRPSLAKSDKEDDVSEEPRRPITRQSLAKNDKDKILAGDENEEPKKPTTRQSITKINADTLVDDTYGEPRRPVTRQSLTKNDKGGLPNELPKETKRQTNTTVNKLPARNDKCLTRDEEAKRPTICQSEPNNDTIVVPDDDNVGEEPKRPVTRRTSAKIDKDTIVLDKEEPKKHVTRKTVAELERSRALGSILSSIDSELDEPNRRTTRQSLQKQKEIAKDNNEGSVLTNELKPETNASKRKSNSRSKKNTAKKSVKKQRGHIKKIEAGDNIDADINDDSVISLSDSDASKSSKILDFSFFSDHTILKASADSTTFESEPNKENANNRTGDDEKLPPSSAITNTESDLMKTIEKDSSLTLDTEVTFSKADIIGDEVHSQSESDKNYSVISKVYLPDTSVSGGSLNNLVNSDSNHGSDTSDDNLKNVSKLVEDVLDESIKDKLSQNQESSIGSSFNAILHPLKDKKAPQPVDEPFQILNDMITDIEERLLKEENEANKNSIENKLNKDTDKLSTPDKDFFNCNTVEVSADSTSFLNYTMDDSFKLMIDESTPQKENTIKEDSLDLKSNGSKANNSKLNLETSTVLTNSSDASDSKKNLNKEAIKELKKEESHFEVSSLKEDNKQAGELEKEDEKSHSDLSSLKEDGSNDVAIIKSKKDVEMLNVEEKVTEEPEEKFIEQSINEKDKPSSAYIDHKFSSCKPLTNEEKIAQLTKRDPRLVNEKKISNVVIRDPRLRNKLPKTENNRDNVLAVQNIEEKVKIPEKLEPKILEPKLTEPRRMESKPLDSKHSEEQKNNCEKEIFDQKPEEKSSELKLVVSKISESKISNSLPEGNIVSLSKDLGGPSQESDAKLPVQGQKSMKNEDYNYDQNRRKRYKKAVDEELIYKTPLSDLHDTHAERSTYERERDYKKKKLFPEGRRVRIITEEREKTFTIPKRSRAVDESNEEKRDYNKSALITNSQGSFRRESQEENFLRPNLELRADHRYSEEVRFREENLTYEEKTYYQEKREILPSGSNESYEQGSYVRRMVTETSYSETIHNRNDFQDNHIYSRREFYRRNRYTHDHDHLGNSSRLLENSNNFRRENETYPQHNNYPVVDEPTFSVSAYPPVSFLPEPMYSQEEELDQSYGNMETESFSPPLLDICPPPPLIRSPTPEFGRRDKYCPSPPRIGGRRDSTDERDYEEFSRAYHRNYENDERSLRGRNNNIRGQRGGNFRRGNGREYNNRWREESPPRKRFAGEYFRGRDDDRGRWRRSPSWSPDRSRRWPREQSPLPREPHPWNSPREAHPWNSPPREQHPWNSPPRNRSPSPPRRRDNYRERMPFYNRY